MKDIITEALSETKLEDMDSCDLVLALLDSQINHIEGIKAIVLETFKRK
jgi:nucleoside 2-deoxyribosyltransferase